MPLAKAGFGVGQDKRSGESPKRQTGRAIEITQNFIREEKLIEVRVIVFALQILLVCGLKID